MFPHVVGLFFKQHSQLHTFTVPRSQALQQWVALIHLSINPKKMQRTGFAMWHDVNQLKWGLFISSTDNCLKTTIFNIKLPLFRQVHGLTVMKRVQKQRHLITIISFLLLARSAMLVPLLKWQPPLKQLSWGVPSCPDRGIFSSCDPKPPIYPLVFLKLSEQKCRSLDIIIIPHTQFIFSGEQTVFHTLAPSDALLGSWNQLYFHLQSECVCVFKV